MQKMGEREVYALDWGIMLHTSQPVTDDITHVGIRGHWIRPAEHDGDNCMAVQVVEYIESTFEHQYLMKNKREEDSMPLWWMCPKRDFEENAKSCQPDYLYFPPEHLMLLRK